MNIKGTVMKIRAARIALCQKRTNEHKKLTTQLHRRAIESQQSAITCARTYLILRQISICSQTLASSDERSPSRCKSH